MYFLKKLNKIARKITKNIWNNQKKELTLHPQ